MPVEVDGPSRRSIARRSSSSSPDDPTASCSTTETASLGRYRPHVTVAPKVHVRDAARCRPTSSPPARSRAETSRAFAAGMDMIREVVKRTDEAGLRLRDARRQRPQGTADGWVDGVMLLTNVDFGGIAFPFALLQPRRQPRRRHRRAADRRRHQGRPRGDRRGLEQLRDGARVRSPARAHRPLRRVAHVPGPVASR